MPADIGADIHGTVQSLPANGLTGDWLVGNRIVHVDSNTIIERRDFTLAANTCVEVRGAAASDGVSQRVR